MFKNRKSKRSATSSGGVLQRNATKRKSHTNIVCWQGPRETLQSKCSPHTVLRDQSNILIEFSRAGVLTHPCSRHPWQIISMNIFCHTLFLTAAASHEIILTQLFCVHKIQTFCSGCMQDDVGMHRLWYTFRGIQSGFELCNQRTIWSPVGGGVPGWFVFAQHTHLNSVKMCPKETMLKIDGKMNNLPIFLKTSNIQYKQFYQSTRNFTTSIP
jgi:hypothetical protein